MKSVSGKTIQLTTRDGGTIAVSIDDGTSLLKIAKGTLSDIAAGAKITVMGESSSGTVTARMITIQ